MSPLHAVCMPDVTFEARDLLDAELDTVVAALVRPPLVRSATWSVETTS